MTKEIPESFHSLIAEVEKIFSENRKISKLFENCFLNTYQTTLKQLHDGTTFVVTGDIPAMWLRDSALQVRPYLMVASKDEQIRGLIKGVIKRQFYYILEDPYANAFNQNPNGMGHQTDETDMSPIVWERKYEIDSLCFPIQLAYFYWQETEDFSIFDSTFDSVLKTIIEIWRVEQRHGEQSSYRFLRRNGNSTDTLTNDGKGADTDWTGMTWSGFRPSDDACLYGYHIPSNMFAVVVLRYATEIAERMGDLGLAKECDSLATEIRDGIEHFGTIEHPLHGRVYVYETNGKGNYVLMDDANVPSLLSAPYLGYCDWDNETYLNTRQLILSRENPYYYEGKQAKGIGSPHTPDHYIWHIALSVQGMTSRSPEERNQLLEYLINTDGGMGYMHEGFNADNSCEFTRKWFAWSNSMFSEFVLSLTGNVIKSSPLNKKSN
ncbi:glycoside hydrolase family 125 protein [Aquibacillus salsiterrae]|uniref:Glycoside hydrolase family 125 protein n=1 Tax=Aquibacillus salsiterrae TaxID=2950439 RepID=A0A9X4AG14_9BACI|nr:glycoside hydrolase family 125 protein [Aquibacillus salsiterrae]MDC3416618.1 glycoside hydrolase family 125 protein [Aquibacillus salsiterrae]